MVLLDLEVLAEISSNPVGQKFYPQVQSLVPLPDHVRQAVETSHTMNEYFTKFMFSLLKLFSTDQSLLEDRGSFIIRLVYKLSEIIWSLSFISKYFIII